MNYNEIISLVYQAREIVFSESKRSQVSHKNPYDFVTAVDTGISDFLKQELGIRYPEVGFMTEEEDVHTITDKMFILDPIDGTTNLVYQYQMSSISLAYAEGGAVVFGVVFNPFTKEMFFGIKGKGSYRISTEQGIDALLAVGVENYNEAPLCCSKRPLNLAIVEFGASVSHKEMSKETFERAERVFSHCLDLRRICSSAISVCYIAAGRLDGYFEKVIKPWDYAAATLILSEAGGRCSTWQGQPLPLDREGTIICSNGVIHDELLSLI